MHERKTFKVFMHNLENFDSHLIAGGYTDDFLEKEVDVEDGDDDEKEEVHETEDADKDDSDYTDNEEDNAVSYTHLTLPTKA